MVNGRKSISRCLLLAATIALIVVHQDWWNWNKVNPRLFGFLPIGLSYHAGFAVACAVLMYCLVRWAWPKHLEQANQVASTDPTAADNTRSH